MADGPVVVGVDGSQESRRALERAVELASASGHAVSPAIVVVHVRETPVAAVTPESPVPAEGELAELTDELDRDSRAMAEEVLGRSGLGWAYVVRSGEPATELIAEATERSSNDIVVGGHRHGPLASVLLHAVDSSLVHRFDGSVLIVRGEDETESGT